MPVTPEGPGTMKVYLKMFKEAGFNYRAVRKLWKLSSDRESMIWTEDDNRYAWTDVRHPKVEREGYQLLDTIVSTDTEGNKKVFYFFVGALTEDLLKRLDRLIGDATLTPDVEVNQAQGHITVIGMRYKKKKRKNKLMGRPIVVHEGQKTFYYKFIPGADESVFEIVARDKKTARNKIKREILWMQQR